MLIKAWSTRDESHIEIGEKGITADDGQERTFRAGIGVFEEVFEHEDDYEPSELKLVAEVYGTFYDDTEIINDGVTRLYYADMIDGDNLDAMAALEKSGLMGLDTGLDMMFSDMHDVYLDRVFVTPEYRNKGVLSTICDNMYEIFKHHFNVHTRCVVVFPYPEEPEDGWKSEEERDELYKVMTEALEKKGFERMTDSEFFGKNMLAVK